MGNNYKNNSFHVKMKTRKTGVGKLSSKLLTMLLAAGITTSAFSADNSIYIDQSGDNAVITVIQDGASNVVKGIGPGNETPAKFNGDNLLVDIEQTGSGNTLSIGVVTGTAGGVPSSVTYKATGNNASAVINMNDSGDTASLSNIINVQQAGDNALTNVNMKGSTNSLTANQRGGNNNKLTATINASGTATTIDQSGGGGNETTLSLTGDKGKVNIVTVGATNTIGISQDGGGVLGHNATVDINGSGNNVSIAQQGSADMTTNIKSVGNSNSVTILQKN